MVEIGTSFQNRFQFAVGVESVNGGQEHKPGLGNAKTEEHRKTVRHGKRSEKRKHKGS